MNPPCKPFSLSSSLLELAFSTLNPQQNTKIAFNLLFFSRTNGLITWMELLPNAQCSGVTPGSYLRIWPGCLFSLNESLLFCLTIDLPIFLSPFLPPSISPSLPSYLTPSFPVLCLLHHYLLQVTMMIQIHVLLPLGLFLQDQTNTFITYWHQTYLFPHISQVAKWLFFQK